MYIHEMTRDECDQALMNAKHGRLACTQNNQPYVLPFDFVFDGSWFLYGFTTMGMKVEWMRSNPLVCFEIDEVKNRSQWTSVIVFGQYEELPDKPEYETARNHAWELLKKRAVWWEPAYVSKEHRDTSHSLTPIFFRMKIETVTGRRANSDNNESQEES